MVTTIGLILAGGRSKRMGRDKALLPLADLPRELNTHQSPVPATFLTYQVALLSALCPQVVVVAGSKEQAARYSALYAPAFPSTLHIALDQQPDQGPLMGLYSGLRCLETLQADCAFVTAVDTPLLQTNCVRWLLAQASCDEIVIPVVESIPQVLLALYPRASLPIIDEFLRAGERSPRKLLQVAPGRQLRVRYLAEELLRTVDPQLRSFRDIDTPEELAKLLKHP